jgi:membrane protein implicated in regulation of membrane protease activity
MDWSAATWWWIAAGALVAIELATGTFYLLMLALGLAAAAVAAHLGLGSTGQIVVAALVGGGATAAWHLRRAREPQAAPSESNRDVNLDIGESVRVDGWRDDRTARVDYRGSAWTVVYRGEGTPTPGEYHIVAVQSNRLVVSPAGRT